MDSSPNKPTVLLFNDSRMPVILSTESEDELVNALTAWKGTPRVSPQVLTINPENVTVVLVGENGGVEYATDRDTTTDSS